MYHFMNIRFNLCFDFAFHLLQIHVTFSEETPNEVIQGDSNAQSSVLVPRKHSTDMSKPSTLEPLLNRQRSHSIPPDIPVKTNKIMLTRKSVSAPTFRRKLKGPQKLTRADDTSKKLDTTDTITIEDLEPDRGDLSETRWKIVATSERPESRQLPSLQQNDVRSQTSSAALLSGRSRRELYHLTHIDAIAAADLELRRRMWFSQLAEKREVEEVHLQCKIRNFIAKVEADKRKLRRTTGMESLLGTDQFLKI